LTSVAALATVLAGGWLSEVKVALQGSFGWVHVHLLLSLVGFFAAMLLALRAAAGARDKIRDMYKVKTLADLSRLRQKRSFKYTARSALWTYSFGLVCFVLLVLSSLFPSASLLVIGINIGVFPPLIILAMVSIFR
jgi:hypothetical protein